MNSELGNGEPYASIASALASASASASNVSKSAYNRHVEKLIVQSLDGKDVRLSRNGDYLRYRCTIVKGKLHVDGEEIKSIFAFMNERGFANKMTYRKLLEVYHEDRWITLDWYTEYITSENGHCLGMMSSSAETKLKECGIATKTEFHHHPLFRYNIVIDVLRGVICPLLRVCDAAPDGDLRRQSVACESAVAYINAMCTHVRSGSRTVSQPFFSASKNLDVVKYHSCAFLKPVILLDQERLKSRAFYFGGPPGRELFGENSVGPVRNFAEFSDEVLVDDFIAATEYSIVEAQFKLKHEVKSCKGFNVPAVDVLRTFQQQPLKTDCGGVLKLTNPDIPSEAYVWKVGNCKGHGSDSHICNEFVANVLYRALGVPVPPAVLRMYRVDLTAMQNRKKVDIHSCDVYVLIHEFIVGEKAQIESHDHVVALASHCLADIVLCNYDVLGPNNLDNIIMRGTEAFRIDTGAALFTKPDGSLKAHFSVSQRKAVDVRKDFITYFSFKTAQCQRILKFLGPRFLIQRVQAMKQTFQKSVSWFINQSGHKPPMWENTLSLIKSRLESLLTIGDPTVFWKETVNQALAKRNEAAISVMGELPEPQVPATESIDDPPVPVELKIDIQGAKKKKFDQASDTVYVNVTSKGEDDFARLSPFTAFRNKSGAAAFKVPFMPDKRSYSVEGIWQGLKVFEREGVDVSKFAEELGKSLKRTIKKNGKVLGHFGGVDQPLLNYVDARKQIYVPSYAHMLKSCCEEEMEALFKLHLEKNIVLLDYYTNDSIEDETTPLSHASLVKERLHMMFVERYPQAVVAAAAGIAGGGGDGEVEDGVTASRVSKVGKKGAAGKKRRTAGKETPDVVSKEIIDLT